MRNRFAIDDFIDDLLGELGDTDYASSAGYPPPAPMAISALNYQVRRWNSIMDKLVQWGVSRNTLRNEQAQIVRDIAGRETQRNNQPDIQAVHPNSRKRINIEVDTNEQNLRNALNVIISNDPNAHVVGIRINGGTGRHLGKYVYTPPAQYVAPRRFQLPSSTFSAAVFSRADLSL
jgi:hypothetical protein